jgi:hypothetical protein
MLMHEFDERLLREVLGAEGLAVDETEDTVDRLKPVLSLIWDVFACEEVDLDRVQLLP